MATYNITLKAWSDNAVLEPLTIYQNDVLSRTINITLMDNNGPPIDLTDSAVRVYFVKDDKKIVYQEADIISETNGKISVTCDSQVTAVPGPVVAMVQAIYNNGSTLNIGPLRLIVAVNNLDNAIISTNDFSALTAALLKADSIKNKVDAVILEGNQLSYVAGSEFEDEKIVDMLEQTKTAVIESDEFKSKADKAELGIRKKVLWNGSLTSNDTTVTLSDDLSNYAMILVVGRANQWGHYPVGVTMPINTIDGAGWHIGTDLNNKLILSTSAELIFQFIDSKSLKSITGFSEINQISTVYGLI